MRASIPIPSRPLVCAGLDRVRAVFSDVDGTLTTAGKLTGPVLRSLERLRDAGVKVVLVTGRPAGFGECFLRTLPVAAVIAENGGLYFAWDGRQRLKKVYAQGFTQRRSNRRRLWQEVRRAMARVPRVRLSTDSAYTEVDLALDYNEEVTLGTGAAEKLVQAFAARGVSAVRSSVHVNCWLGGFDKQWMVQRFLKNEWKVPWPAAPGEFVYVGDSLNDAPMFNAFPLSVGVANVLEVWEELEAFPRFVTRAREGAGFVELANRILKARGQKRV